MTTELTPIERARGVMQFDETKARLAAEIASATLRNAAIEAIGLLGELGQADHIVTRKLAAALAREGGE
jgi:hypothetical protein